MEFGASQLAAAASSGEDDSTPPAAGADASQFPDASQGNTFPEQVEALAAAARATHASGLHAILMSASFAATAAAPATAADPAAAEAADDEPPTTVSAAPAAAAPEVAWMEAPSQGRCHGIPHVEARVSAVPRGCRSSGRQDRKEWQASQFRHLAPPDEGLNQLTPQRTPIPTHRRHCHHTAKCRYAAARNASGSLRKWVGVVLVK